MSSYISWLSYEQVLGNFNKIQLMFTHHTQLQFIKITWNFGSLLSQSDISTPVSEHIFLFTQQIKEKIMAVETHLLGT